MRAYFAHSYSADLRPYNERIWRVLMASGFTAWIDSGTFDDKRVPMDVSFNEWMLARADAFIMVSPAQGSPYIDLEYRLARRRALPSLVIGLSGTHLTHVDLEAPQRWNQFLEPTWIDQLRRSAQELSDCASQRRSWLDAARSNTVPCYRPKSGAPTVAMLPPANAGIVWGEWLEAHAKLNQHNVATTVIEPSSIKSARHLLANVDQKFDFLVVDVGPRGTPHEMIGQLEAFGIPLVRVCKIADDEEQSLAETLRLHEFRQRFQHSTDGPGLPLTCDGLKLDDGMTPVLFWQSPTDLVKRVHLLVGRVNHFRQDDRALDSHDAARAYFSPTNFTPDPGDVFISMAREGGAGELASRLAEVVRFHNHRCFYYRSSSALEEGRLESGEEVDAGLRLRVQEAHDVIALVDESYLNSRYCQKELDDAHELVRQGRLKLRVYRESDNIFLGGDFQNTNALPSAGGWNDPELLERIVKDVESDLAKRGWLLTLGEHATLQSWLNAGGHTSPDTIRSLLVREGMEETDLGVLGLNREAEDWLVQLLRLPPEPEARRRKSAACAVLLTELSRRHPSRRETATRWLARLVARVRRPVVEPEDCLEIEASPLPLDLKNRLNFGIALADVYPRVCRSTRSLVIKAGRGGTKIPIEWTRANTARRAACEMHAIRWHLDTVDHRATLMDEYAKVTPSLSPPLVLLLALKGDMIHADNEVAVLGEELRMKYEHLGWPRQWVHTEVCENANEVLDQLTTRHFQILHIAGHLGPSGLALGGQEISSKVLCCALNEGDARLVVLNGCGGAAHYSPLEDYTLAEDLVYEAKVPEVVAHRSLLTDADALAFAKSFYGTFLEGFNSSEAALAARKRGSEALLMDTIVISQRAQSDE